MTKFYEWAAKALILGGLWFTKRGVSLMNWSNGLPPIDWVAVAKIQAELDKKKTPGF